jgi:cell division protein ZapA
MAQVTVLVNGRNYTLACEDGEEEHLSELAGFIDNRVAELGRSVGQVGDARLLLMASLVVADELGVAHERVDELELEVVEGNGCRAAVPAGPAAASPRY